MGILWANHIIFYFTFIFQVAKLKSPRRVMLLVKAGAPVDAFIDKLVPLLDKGDIIIDGGNSEYQDSRYVSRKYQKVTENLLGKLKR